MVTIIPCSAYSATPNLAFPLLCTINLLLPEKVYKTSKLLLPSSSPNEKAEPLLQNWYHEILLPSSEEPIERISQRRHWRTSAHRSTFETTAYTQFQQYMHNKLYNNSYSRTVLLHSASTLGNQLPFSGNFTPFVLR